MVTYYDPQGPDLFVQDQTARHLGGCREYEIECSGIRGRSGGTNRVTEQPDFRWRLASRISPSLDERHCRTKTGDRPGDGLDQGGQSEGGGGRDWIVPRVRKDEGVLLLDVAVDGGNVLGRIPFYKEDAPQSLVSVRVRLRGTCGADFNSNYQLVGVNVHVPNLSQMTILQPALADPFQTPMREIPDVMRFNPEGTLENRVRVRGVVAMYRAGKSVFIQNSEGSLYARTEQTAPQLEPGDEVEVVGFPAVGPYTPELQNAIYRRVGKAPIPQPVSRWSTNDASAIPHPGVRWRRHRDTRDRSISKS